MFILVLVIEVLIRKKGKVKNKRSITSTLWKHEKSQGLKYLLWNGALEIHCSIKCKGYEVVLKGKENIPAQPYRDKVIGDTVEEKKLLISKA